MAMKWYVVHTQTGAEEKAKAGLDNRIQTTKLKEYIEEVVVPTEQVSEVRGGKKRIAARKFFPGYILVNMEMNEHSWHTVVETPRVTGFVGVNANQAIGDREIYKMIPALTQEEADKIIGRIAEGAEKPKPKVIYEVGDVVRVIEGPFANFQGTVAEVFPDKGRVRVMVSIFGRSTPVELEYIQVSNN